MFKPLARVREPEIMDDPGLDPAAHSAALRGLARINRVSGAAGVLWRRIAPLAREHAAGRPLRVVDVAAGSGDVVLTLARRARAARLPIEFSATDISAHACETIAARAARERLAVRALRHDLLASALPERADVVCNALFLHHFDPREVCTALRRMRSAAERLLVVSDLRRTRPGLAAAYVVPRLLTRSWVVHTDAVLSVRAAYTREELAELAGRAELAGHTIRRVFPWRMLLTWSPK